MTQSNAFDTSATLTASSERASFLGPSDPAPVELCHPHATSPILLLCEHAGQAIPDCLDGLGLAAGVIDQHIGWDIGAENLARAVSDRLSCPLIIQRYSRLVMDCNRPPGAEGSIPEISDGVRVPGNTGLSAEQHSLRRRAIFDPMNNAISAAFEAHPRKAVFSIHSYTRSFQGMNRPWDAGFLTRRDIPTAQRMMSIISSKAAEYNLALNQPYQIDDASDWFIPRHAEARNMQHTLIEVCNDHLRDAAQIARWADLLASAIQAVLEDAP